MGTRCKLSVGLKKINVERKRGILALLGFNPPNLRARGGHLPSQALPCGALALQRC